MIGVADAAFAALGQVPDPDDAADLARMRAAATEALGPTDFDREYAVGQHLEPRAAFGAVDPQRPSPPRSTAVFHRSGRLRTIPTP